jgi:uncharacterized protein (DUF302 family)
MATPITEQVALHKSVCRKTVSEIADLLPGIAAKHGFGVLGTRDLGNILREKGVPFRGKSLVFDVCNPAQAMTALEREPSISSVLPCRISVYEDDGKTFIATIKPTALLKLFGNRGLDLFARQVEETLTAIVDETASA